MSLSSGLQPRANLVDAELGGDGLGGGLVVAGRHHDLQAQSMQLGDGLRGGRLDRIGNSEEAGKLAVDGEEHHRLAVFAHRLGAGGERRGIDAGALHQPLIAEQHLFAVDAAFDALAGDRGEALGLDQLEPALLCAKQDRLRRADARCRLRSRRRISARRHR